MSITYHKSGLIGVQPFISFSRVCFYIFLFSLPFESSFISGGLLGLSASNSVWSLSRITGLILIAALLFSRRLLFSFHLPSVWGFFAYIFLFLAGAVFTSFFSNYPFSSDLFVIPWMILIFIVCCEFFMDASARNQGLKVLMVAISLCALLQIWNLSFNRNFAMEAGSSEMRIAAFGEDPNFIGAQYAVGILIAILFMLDILACSRRFKIISLFGGIVCLLALIQTGSRGAAICFVIALTALLLNKQTARKRKMIWLTLIITIGLLGVLITSSSGFLSRFQDTINSGDTSQRTDIYQASFNIFLASPLIGYGPGFNTLVLGYDLEKYRKVDTHNTLLWVLTASGLVGFIPFFFGFSMCFIQAFRARNGQEDVAPLILCGLAIVFCQTVSWQEEKLFWVLLAFGATAVMSKNTSLNKILKVK
jgi:O-antigen ligase